MNPPRTVLLLAAIDVELDATRKRLRLKSDGDTWRGRSGDSNIVAAITGIGGERARSNLHQLVAAHQPTSIINLGFAGGLDPKLRAGDIVVPTRIINAQGGEVRVSGLGSGVAGDEKPGCETKLLTVDRIAASIEEKRALYEAHAAVAVDMESFALADAARDCEANFTVVRAISDDAMSVLPAESLNWVTPDGRSDTAAAMRHLARKPWRLKTLLTLQQNARTAGEELANRVERWIG